MDIVPASNFTFAELTEAYNQTRVDYLVPMPMNTTRLMEYAHVYDISLEHSAVARQGDLLYGLGMLGVREKRAWITRLGVLPNGRRRGTGSALMERLLSEAKRSAAEYTWLEVIKGNDPAYHLFKNYQFEETRELIVARRPPTPDINQEILERIANITVLDHDEAVALLQNRIDEPNWLNQSESFHHVANLSALFVECKDGGRGWVIYHAGLMQLTRSIVNVLQGNSTDMTETILTILHQRHQRQDAITENLYDPERWEGFQRAGYFESFRRVEMVRPM